MLPNAKTGSHISVITYPSSHPSCFPFLPSTLPSILPSCHFSFLSGCTVLPPFLLSPTAHPPHVSSQLSDLSILSAAGDHWLPSSWNSSDVHPQCEVGYFKAYLASALMSKESHAVLLMAVIWLQLPRLLGVCLYIT